MENNDSRYPYTYACDYLRGLAGNDEYGTKLSRADASQVREGIAAALGMADDELARRLADYYKANQGALTALDERKPLPHGEVQEATRTGGHRGPAW